MLIGLRDQPMLTVILAAILEKIEGEIFVSEQDRKEIHPDTTISMVWDEARQGWRVRLREPEETF